MKKLLTAVFSLASGCSGGNVSPTTTLVQTEISSNNSREDCREILYGTFVICMTTVLTRI